jgi:hypothetical protein
MKSWLEVSQLLVNVAGIAILALTAWNLYFASRSLRRQMNLQIYLEFTKRYEELMRQSPEEARTSLLGRRLSEIEPTKRGEVKAHALQYLNLSSEEYHLMESGYLDREVWELWRHEMEWTLRTTLFRTAWPELKHQFASFPEFSAYMERVQRDAGAEQES